MSYTYPDLSSSIAAWMVALQPLFNPNDVTVAATTQAMASAIADLYAYLDSTAGNAFLSTAYDDGLTALAADHGFDRPAGGGATVTLTVTLIGAQPSGWQIDSTMQFATTGDPVRGPILFQPTGVTPIAATQTTATITATATSVGAATNVAAGTVTMVVGQNSYIKAVTNPAPAAGGADPMSDQLTLSNTQALLAPDGTVTKMQRTAAAQPGVLAAAVIDARDQTGTVTCYALDSTTGLTGATTTPYVAVPLFLSDAMTGTAGTTLPAHTGELGATWTAHSSYGSSAAVIDTANRLRSNAASTTSLFYGSGVSAGSGTPPPEYDVWADLYVASVLGMAGVAGRIVTGSNTYYVGRYNSTTTGWELYKIVGGVSTQLGTTAAQTLTVGTTYRLKLQLRNGSQKLLVSTDGGVTYTTKVTATDADASLTTAGRVGVYFVDGATASTDTTGLHIDQLCAIGPGSAESGASGAVTITNAVTLIAPPGNTLKVASFAVTTANVTVTSCAQVAGSGLTATMIQTTITNYINTLAPGVTFSPSALVAYLFGTAYPGALSDCQLASQAPVTVPATGIVRAGTVTISAGP